MDSSGWHLRQTMFIPYFRCLPCGLTTSTRPVSCQVITAVPITTFAVFQIGNELTRIYTKNDPIYELIGDLGKLLGWLDLFEYPEFAIRAANGMAVR